MNDVIWGGDDCLEDLHEIGYRWMWRGSMHHNASSRECGVGLFIIMHLLVIHCEKVHYTIHNTHEH